MVLTPVRYIQFRPLSIGTKGRGGVGTLTARARTIHASTSALTQRQPRSPGKIRTGTGNRPVRCIAYTWDRLHLRSRARSLALSSSKPSNSLPVVSFPGPQGFSQGYSQCRGVPNPLENRPVLPVCLLVKYQVTPTFCHKTRPAVLLPGSFSAV